MSGEVPEGWEKVEIGSMFGLSTPGHWGEDGQGDGNILVLRSANFLKAGGLNYETAALRKFDAKKLVQKRLEPGDLLLERSGGSPAQPVGRVNRFDEQGDFSASNFLQILRVRDEVDDWFAYYLLDSFYAQRGTEHLQKATTGIRNLDFATYLATTILLPPLDEQRRIAEVLRSVDEAVAGELAVLGQKQATYDSTMSTFLATGNDADNGVPTDEWITGRVKAVRRIPKSWRITRLIEVAKLESGHTPSRTVEAYWKDGDIGWISLHDTKNLERREIQETALKITAAGVANSSARMLPQGTVCLSRTATVGKSVIMGRPMTTSQDFANFVCSPALNNRYLLHLFRWMGPIWKALSSGSTHKTIYMPTFQALQIILPPIEEQERVAATLDAIASAIELSTEHLESLRELRRSISSDLLSGRVRVPA